MSNINPVDDLKNQIQLMKPQIKAALPPHIEVDKFTRVVMTALVSNPDLVKATRQSFFGACLKMAADGLICDGRESAIVTFKNKQGEFIAQYMPMVGGILKKVRQSGELLSITANIVHENDKFTWFIDADGEHVEHRPLVFGDRGKAIGVYALAKTKDGGLYVEIMDVNQINAVKNSSRSKEYGPWSSAFSEEMWKKTAIRRLSKRLPMSTDLEQTIKRDDDLYLPEPDKQPDVTPKPQQIEAPKTKPTKLKQLMKTPEAMPEIDNDTEEQEVEI